MAFLLALLTQRSPLMPWECFQAPSLPLGTMPNAIIQGSLRLVRVRTDFHTFRLVRRICVLMVQPKHESTIAYGTLRTEHCPLHLLLSAPAPLVRQSKVPHRSFDFSFATGESAHFSLTTTSAKRARGLSAHSTTSQWTGQLSTQIGMEDTRHADVVDLSLMASRPRGSSSHDATCGSWVNPAEFRNPSVPWFFHKPWTGWVPCFVSCWMKISWPHTPCLDPSHSCFSFLEVHSTRCQRKKGLLFAARAKLPSLRFGASKPETGVRL